MMDLCIIYPSQAMGISVPGASLDIQRLFLDPLLQIPFLLASMVLVTLKVNIQLPFEVQSQSTYDKLRRIDWMGSLTLVSGVGCLLLSVSLKTAEDIPWSSPLVLGLFIASFISIVLFVIVEARWSPAPVMPMRLLMQRTPMTVALANL